VFTLNHKRKYTDQMTVTPHTSLAIGYAEQNLSLFFCRNKRLLIAEKSNPATGTADQTSMKRTRDDVDALRLQSENAKLKLWNGQNWNEAPSQPTRLFATQFSETKIKRDWLTLQFYENLIKILGMLFALVVLQFSLLSQASQIVHGYKISLPQLNPK